MERWFAIVDMKNVGEVVDSVRGTREMADKKAKEIENDKKGKGVDCKMTALGDWGSYNEMVEYFELRGTKIASEKRLIKCEQCICKECDHKNDCEYDHCNDDCEPRHECEKNNYGWINPFEE